MAFPLSYSMASRGKQHRIQAGCEWLLTRNASQSGMALVLVEGEEQLHSLVAQAINATASRRPAATNAATGYSPARAVRIYGAYAIAAALSFSFACYWG